MNWAAEQRQQFIKETLEVFGFINRVHLQRKFRVSVAQAALDLREFRSVNPDLASYDARKKIYISTTAPKTIIDHL